MSSTAASWMRASLVVVSTIETVMFSKFAVSVVFDVPYVPFLCGVELMSGKQKISISTDVKI